MVEDCRTIFSQLDPFSAETMFEKNMNNRLSSDSNDGVTTISNQSETCLREQTMSILSDSPLLLDQSRPSLFVNGVVNQPTRTLSVDSGISLDSYSSESCEFLIEIPEIGRLTSILDSPSTEKNLDESPGVWLDSPEDFLDKSPDVLSDPTFTQATLDTIATEQLTPLIKQELKCLIQYRRCAEGQDISPTDADSEESPKIPYQPTEEDLKRKHRRRDLNKKSARKCRERRHVESDALDKEATALTETNQQLMEEIASLQNEKVYLEKLLTEHKCRRPAPYTKPKKKIDVICLD